MLSDGQNKVADVTPFGVMFKGRIMKYPDAVVNLITQDVFIFLDVLLGCVWLCQKEEKGCPCLQNSGGIYQDFLAGIFTVLLVELILGF